jgi:hypothetical protein
MPRCLARRYNRNTVLQKARCVWVGDTKAPGMPLDAWLAGCARRPDYPHCGVAVFLDKVQPRNNFVRTVGCCTRIAITFKGRLVYDNRITRGLLSSSELPNSEHSTSCLLSQNRRVLMAPAPSCPRNCSRHRFRAAPSQHRGHRHQSPPLGVRLSNKRVPRAT